MPPEVISAQLRLICHGIAVAQDPLTGVVGNRMIWRLGAAGVMRATTSRVAGPGCVSESAWISTSGLIFPASLGPVWPVEKLSLGLDLFPGPTSPRLLEILFSLKNHVTKRDAAVL